MAVVKAGDRGLGVGAGSGRAGMVSSAHCGLNSWRGGGT